VLAVPHIVFDGSSLRVLLTELGTAYSALAAGSPPALPPLPLAYTDVARWQAGRLAAGDHAEQLRYWRDRLADPPPPVELPGPPGPAGPAPDRYTVHLGPELTAAVRAAAREHRVTPFVALLAAYATLLHRWSRQDDLVVGVPFGDRDVPGTEGLVGFFVTTVGLRVRLDGRPSFAEVVRRARAAVAGCAPHRDVPFDVVHHGLGRSGGEGLFRTWFNLLGPPDPAPAMAGLDTAVLDPPVPGALFDLGVYGTELPGDLRLDVVADPARVDPAAAAELLDQYVLLLRQVVADPDRPVAGLDLRTPAAAAVLPDPAAPLPTGAATESLPATVARWAARTPDAVAVSAPGLQVTYRELAGWAGGIAAALRARGVAAGGLVAVHLDRGPALVPALVGVLDAGAAFTVLDPALPAGRLSALLRAAGPVVLLAAGDPPALPGLPPVVAVPASPGPGAALTAAPHPEGPERPAYLAFTSGSTGRPRAVLGGQRAVLHFLDWYAGAAALTAADRVGLLSGLGHDPLLRDVFAPLRVGGTVCVPAPHLTRSPRELRAWLAAERVTVAHLTPPLARLLTAAAGPALADLRLVVLGGDHVRGEDVAALREAAPGVTVVNAYGATETPQVVGWEQVPPDRAAPPGRVPVGRGIDGVQLLVRAAGGQPAGIGEPGRVVVRSPFLALGYAAPPDADADAVAPPDADAVAPPDADADADAVAPADAGTGAAGSTDVGAASPGPGAVAPREPGPPGFEADPIAGHRRYDTGDIGRFLPDGRLELLGRDDDQTKIDGFRVQPTELDRALRRRPDVLDCVSLPRPGRDGVVLVSWVVPAAGGTVTLERLRAELRRELPGYLLPAAVVPVPALPLTANGKLDRAALPDPVPEQEPVPRADEAPRTAAEQAVAEVWARVLDRPGVGLDANFFDLGGSSLLMVRAQLALQRELDREVSILTLFEYPTVRGLAAHLAGTAEDTPLGRVRRRPPVPVTGDAGRRLAVRRAIRQEDLA
jgi:amino acid adenylation domain-containing protein